MSCFFFVLLFGAAVGVRRYDEKYCYPYVPPAVLAVSCMLPVCVTTCAGSVLPTWFQGLPAQLCFLSMLVTNDTQQRAVVAREFVHVIITLSTTLDVGPSRDGLGRRVPVLVPRYNAVPSGMITSAMAFRLSRDIRLVPTPATRPVLGKCTAGTRTHSSHFTPRLARYVWK